MIQFTCINCEHKYTQITGDCEERMCNECLYTDTIDPHMQGQIDSHCNDQSWK